MMSLTRAMKENETQRNASGYIDPTAYQAIKRVDADDERFYKLVYAIIDICDLAGFRLEDIVLRDLESDKIWE